MDKILKNKNINIHASDNSIKIRSKWCIFKIGLQEYPETINLLQNTIASTLPEDVFTQVLINWF